jgi:HK97 gp10 family phage protein
MASVEVRCDVQGVEQFQEAIRSFDSGFQRQVHRFLVSWAADVKAEAMRKVPVGTGYLRSTIYAQIQDWVARIGAEASYAYFVEKGTRYMAAQPYLYPSIQEYLPELEAMVKEALTLAKQEAGFQ